MEDSELQPKDVKQENDAEKEAASPLGNPKLFLEKFYQSSFFTEAYEDFLKGKVLASDVTEEEKMKAFLESENAKFALMDYSCYEQPFTYDSTQYPPASQVALKTYIESVKYILQAPQKAEFPLTAEEIENMDRLRFIYHQAVAEQLVKDNIVPSRKLGRALARLILVSLHLEKFDQARVPDIQKITQKYTQDR